MIEAKESAVAGEAQVDSGTNGRRSVRRRTWWLVGATVLGSLLCVQPLFASDDSAPFHWFTEAPDEGGPAAPASPTGLASPTAAPATSAAAAPTATPARTATPAARPTPSPVLLGPADRAGVRDLAGRYCDRHAKGAAPLPRADGRWQCTRLLVLVDFVDMDTACADAYGAKAYSQNPDPRDAYAWRCYRR